MSFQPHSAWILEFSSGYKGKERSPSEKGSRQVSFEITPYLASRHQAVGQAAFSVVFSTGAQQWYRYAPLIVPALRAMVHM